MKNRTWLLLSAALILFSINVAGQKVSVTWTGAVSADWSTGANWSTGTVPGIADDAMITTIPGYQPIINGAVPTIHSLTIEASRSLTVNGSLSVSGDINHSGSLFINTSGIVTAGAGFSVTGAASITVNGFLRFCGSSGSFSGDASINGTGIVEVGVGRTLSIDGNLNVNAGFSHSGIVDINAGWSLTANGHFSHAGSMNLNASASGSATLTVTRDFHAFNGSTLHVFRSSAFSSVFNINGSFTSDAGAEILVEGSCNSSFTAGGSFEHHGTLEVAAGGSFTANASVSFHHYGTIHINRVGSGSVSGSFTTNGSFSAASGSTLHIYRTATASGAFTANAGFSTESGSSLIVEGSFHKSAGSNFTHAGRIDVNAGGFFDVYADISVSAGGQIHVHGSSSGGSSGGQVETDGTLVLNPDANITIYEGGIASGSFTAKNSILVAASATIDVSGSFHTDFSTGGVFNHFGTLTVEGSGSFSANGNVTFTHYGIINVNATASASGSATFEGQVVAGNGSLFTVFRSGSSSARLNISASGILTVDAGGEMHVHGELNVAGTAYFNGSTTLHAGSSTTISGRVYIGTSGSTALVLEANAGGYASLTCSAGGTISGSANVQLFLTPDTWHYIASPVFGATASVFLGDWLRLYDETIGDWSNGSHVPGAYITDPDQELVRQCGYQAWKPATSIYEEEFVGEMNNGVMPYYTLTRTYHPGFPPPNDYDGWNLIGNPYPGNIDLREESGWVWEYVDPNAYFWDGDWVNPQPPYEKGRYAVWNWSENGTSQNGGSPIVPSMQSFFVHCNAIPPETGAYSINNLARTNERQEYWKSSSVTPTNELRLWAKYENDGLDELVVRFLENSSQAFDPLFDAPKKFGFQTLQLCALTTDGYQTAINSVPVESDQATVPVDLLVRVSGQYSIAARQLESFAPEASILLEDLKTSAIHDFGIDSVYSFTADTADDPHRFLLRFADVFYTGASENNKVQGLRIYSFDSRIMILNDSPGTGMENIAVYDMLGRIILRTDLPDNPVNMISFNGNLGYYFVRVISGGKIVTQKIFLDPGL